MYINLARYSRWPCRCVCVVWQHYCTDCRGYTWSSVCFCSLQVCLGVQRTIWSIGSHCTVYTSLDHISTWGHILLCVLALHCQTFCPIICQSGNVTMECCNAPQMQGGCNFMVCHDVLKSLTSQGSHHFTFHALCSYDSVKSLSDWVYNYIQCVFIFHALTSCPKHFFP